MNRVIKFRVWDGKEMLYPSAMNPAITIAPECDDSSLIYVLEWDADGDMETAKISVINGACMQFTGLTDNNGVDIYEGDIIERKLNCMIDKGNITEEVNFSHGKFNSGDADLHNIIKLFNGVVIGNIHENN